MNTKQELVEQVHRLTGLNCHRRSIKWLRAKLQEVAEKDHEHQIIARMAAAAGSRRKP